MLTLAALPLWVAQVEMDPLSAAVQSRGMVLVVLIALVLMSVTSWVVIGSRLHALRKLRADIDAFRAEFGKFHDIRTAQEAIGKRHVGLPHMRLVHAVLKEMHHLEQDGPLGEVDLEGLERAMRRSAEPLVEEMEAGLGLLATTASAAPFIGLFGTVWGIMGAFGGLADSGSILQTVAPHIAQALVATAVGLLAAIPASMAYNGLGRVVRRLVIDLDGFGLELLNLVRRQHLRGRMVNHAGGDELPIHVSEPTPVTAPAALEAAMQALDSALDRAGGVRGGKAMDPAPPLPGQGQPPALPDSGVYNAVPDPHAAASPAAAEPVTEVARPASLAGGDLTPPTQ